MISIIHTSPPNNKPGLFAQTGSKAITGFL